MKAANQLVILSGKGGTGKTSFTAAFAQLAAENTSRQQNVLVDADVDAANLSLVLDPEYGEPAEFWGSSIAHVDPEKCIGCGACSAVCRYDALWPDPNNNSVYWVDPIACDGCAACVYGCPMEAIRMIPNQAGYWYESTTKFGKLFHAELFPGGENSGKLVTLIRQMAKNAAEQAGSKLIIIDGPPGIGCPVISACTGTDLGLIIIEPSKAGLHDLKRVVGVLQHFRIPVMICINKFDIYPEGTRQIHEFATEEEIKIVGEVPFDEHIPQAMVSGKPVTVSFPDCEASKAIRSVWIRVSQAILQEDGAIKD